MSEGNRTALRRVSRATVAAAKQAATTGKRGRGRKLSSGRRARTVVGAQRAIRKAGIGGGGVANARLARTGPTAVQKRRKSQQTQLRRAGVRPSRISKTRKGRTKQILNRARKQGARK